MHATHEWADVDQHEVVVGATRDERVAVLDHVIGQLRGVGEHRLLVLLVL
eukprot:SAG25_NODE_1838_length_2277_cov_3.380051_1_plen_49_part_10